MSRIRGSRGFTLMEVVIASLLLAIIVAGIAVFFFHIVRNSTEMDLMTKGLQYCREKLEQMRTLDVASMPDGTGPVEVLPDGFQRVTTISSPYAEYPAAKLVRCNVTWNSPDGTDSTSLSILF
ncbi:MAG: prepilin-type N-terminal cleavage/methylation domain-containing protein [Candidatus Fermentibacteraceae bacterium]